MELEPPGIIPPDDDPVLGRDPIVARVESLLDAGKDEEALAMAEQALVDGEGNALDLRYLAGDALLALGRAAEAETRFRAVLDVDAQCAASRCWLAMALYRQWRFAEAEVECELALRAPEPAVDAHIVRGLLFERAGAYAAADACFHDAARLDPERFHRPVRMSRTEFDREVRQAARRLPRQFRKHLERLPVIVQELPSVELGRDGEQVLDPDLLGLFDGVPLPETSTLEGGALRPNYIYLFQRNLERFARDREDLVEQISVTLYHELGHYLGFEEEDMDELGLA
jgi:predicted Zn-dependent protease with MMP-like domain